MLGVLERRGSISIRPDSNELIREASSLLSQGRTGEAELVALRALTDSPESTDARALVATARMRRGDSEGARAVCLDGLAIDPASRNCLSLLATIAWNSGDMAGAKDRLEELIRHHPRDARALNNLGMCLASQGDDASAAETFERAIAIEPNIAMFHFNLANSLHNLDRPHEAIQGHRRAVALDPGLMESWLTLGTLLVVVRDDTGAAQAFRRAFELEPDSPRGLVAGARAEIYADSDLKVAQGRLLEALRIQPDLVAAHALLGHVYQKAGELGKAQHHLRIAIEADPANPAPYADLVLAKRVDEGDIELIDRMIAFERESWDANTKRMLSYGLGKAFDDLGRYEEAMRYFDQAHDVERERFGRRFDRKQYSEEIDFWIRCFPGERPETPASPSRRPIFIVGRMRSGTTLAEQVLSAHPDVAGAGELDFWIKHAREAVLNGEVHGSSCGALIEAYEELLAKIDPDRPHVTDKQPANYRFLGLINALFPEAKIVHCRRHPIDNCLSIYMQTFLTPPHYAHDKSDLVYAYREYQRLMRHWSATLPAGAIFDLDYSRMVNEPEATIRELLSFCGLSWSEVCLRPEANLRPVLTASNWQVRQPIYKTSVARWKNYEPWLGPLADLANDEP